MPDEDYNAVENQKGVLPIGTLITEGIGAIGGLITGVFGIFKAKAERKAAKEKHEQDIEAAQVEAEIGRAKEKAVSDRAWEARGQIQSGWKDEFFLVVLSIPIIGVFIPPLRPFMIDGFTALKTHIPDWWLWLWMICFGSAYGVKKVVNFMQIKKGS